MGKKKNKSKKARNAFAVLDPSPAPDAVDQETQEATAEAMKKKRQEQARKRCNSEPKPSSSRGINGKKNAKSVGFDLSCNTVHLISPPRNRKFLLSAPLRFDGCGFSIDEYLKERGMLVEREVNEASKSKKKKKNKKGKSSGYKRIEKVFVETEECLHEPHLHMRPPKGVLKSSSSGSSGEESSNDDDDDDAFFKTQTSTAATATTGQTAATPLDDASVAQVGSQKKRKKKKKKKKKSDGDTSSDAGSETDEASALPVAEEGWVPVAKPSNHPLEEKEDHREATAKHGVHSQGSQPKVTDSATTLPQAAQNATSPTNDAAEEPVLVQPSHHATSDVLDPSPPQSPSKKKKKKKKKKTGSSAATPTTGSDINSRPKHDDSSADDAEEEEALLNLIYKSKQQKAQPMSSSAAHTASPKADPRLPDPPLVSQHNKKAETPLSDARTPSDASDANASAIKKYVSLSPDFRHVHFRDDATRDNDPLQSKPKTPNTPNTPSSAKVGAQDHDTRKDSVASPSRANAPQDVAAVTASLSEPAPSQLKTVRVEQKPHSAAVVEKQFPSIAEQLAGKPSGQAVDFLLHDCIDRGTDVLVVILGPIAIFKPYFSTTQLCVRYKTAHSRKTDPSLVFDWTVDLFGKIDPVNCSSLRKQADIIHIILRKAANTSEPSAMSRPTDAPVRYQHWAQLRAIKHPERLAQPATQDADQHMPLSASTAVDNGREREEKEGEEDANDGKDSEPAGKKIAECTAATTTTTTSTSSTSIEDSTTASYDDLSEGRATDALASNDPKEEFMYELTADRGMATLHNPSTFCYMNSVWQCVIKTPKIADLFRRKDLSSLLNRDSSFGTKGVLALRFAELFSKTWNTDLSPLNPVSITRVMQKRYPDFNFGQHDAHEFLEVMLDTLHEDLNKNAKKPFVELPDTVSFDSVVQTAHKCWSDLLQRDDSPIVDVFQGQLTSRVTCPTCKSHSISFDLFRSLNLALPAASKQKYVYVIDGGMLGRKASQKNSGGKQGSFIDALSEVLLTIERKPVIIRPTTMVKDVVDEVVECSLKQQRPYVFFSTQQNKAKKIFLPNHLLHSNVSERDVLVCWLRPPSSGPSNRGSDTGSDASLESERATATKCALVSVACKQVCALESCAVCEKSVAGNSDLKLRRCAKCKQVAYCGQDCQRSHWGKHKKKCKAHSALPVCMPFVVEFKDETRVSTLKQQLMRAGKAVLGQVQPLFDASSLISGTTIKVSNEGTYSDEAWQAAVVSRPLPPSPQNSQGMDTAAAPPHADDAGPCTVSPQISSHSPWTPSIVIDKKAKTCRDLAAVSIISVDVQSTSIKGLSTGQAAFEQLMQPQATKEGKRVATAPRPPPLPYAPPLAVSECIEHYMRQEQLCAQNEWHCKTCKSSQQAMKQLYLSRLPQTLILQLKRFNANTPNSFFHGKLQTPVRVEPTLDVGPYRLQNADGTGATSGQGRYRLFAVINHYGLHFAGHYTAHVQHLVTGKWHLFNDKNFAEIREEAVFEEASPAPYVLFYERTQ